MEKHEFITTEQKCNRSRHPDINKLVAPSSHINVSLHVEFARNRGELIKTPNFSSGKYVNISSVENETIMCLHCRVAFSIKHSLHR